MILGLLAVMLFSMQRSVWLYTKQRHKIFETHQAFEALEQMALIKPEPTKLCLSYVLDVNYAESQLKAGQGCLLTRDNVQYRYWVNELGYPDKQEVLAISRVFTPSMRLVIRFAKAKEVMSWRYLVD